MLTYADGISLSVCGRKNLMTYKYTIQPKQAQNTDDTLAMVKEGHEGDEMVE
jgi:hypothetical protein